MVKGLLLVSDDRAEHRLPSQDGRSFKLPVLIRRTMELVEQIARFRAPKYLSAYIDILNMHLTSQSDEKI